MSPFKLHIHPHCRRTWRYAAVFSPIFLSALHLSDSSAQTGEAVSPYGYYYHGNYVEMAASNQLVAFRGSGADFEDFLRRYELERDELSDHFAARECGYSFYRGRQADSGLRTTNSFTR